VIRYWLPVVVMLNCLAIASIATAREVTLGVPPALIESGLLKHILPRFSLKTGIVIAVKPIESKDFTADIADVVLARSIVQAGGVARAVMGRNGQTYYVASAHLQGGENTRTRDTARFVDWILSEIGQRTIEAFKAPEGGGFKGLAGTDSVEVAVVFDGNRARGQVLSLRYCGRCHVIGDVNRMKGLGSTPSFGVLRTFPDWQPRFEAFFTLRPHPSFSQIIGVTEPFDPARPPPVFPLEISLEQLDDILAYVATIAPADLGAPLQHQ